MWCEERLRTSEERLALAVGAAELGTFYCPMPLGDIIWNDKCKEHFWLQFVPVAGGLAWFAYQWRRHGRAWDWADQLPWLLLVSFVTSPYGAWHFDLVLLLVAVVARAARFAGDGLTPAAWFGVALPGYAVHRTASAR